MEEKKGMHNETSPVQLDQPQKAISSSKPMIQRSYSLNHAGQGSLGARIKIYVVVVRAKYKNIVGRATRADVAIRNASSEAVADP
jgi:hypothetical protein